MPIIGIAILSAAGAFLVYAFSQFFRETLKLRRQARRARHFTVAFPRKVVTENVVTENKVRPITALRRESAHHTGTKNSQQHDDLQAALLPAGVHRLAMVRRIRS